VNSVLGYVTLGAPEIHSEYMKIGTTNKGQTSYSFKLMARLSD